MTITSTQYQVRAGDKVKLTQWPTRDRSYYRSKVQYRRLLYQHIKELSMQQSLLYACNR